MAITRHPRPARIAKDSYINILNLPGKLFFWSLSSSTGTARQNLFASFTFLPHKRLPGPASSPCVPPSLSVSPFWVLLSLETLPQLAAASSLPAVAARTCRLTVKTESTSSRFPTTTTPTSLTVLSLVTTGVTVT